VALAENVWDDVIARPTSAQNLRGFGRSPDKLPSLFRGLACSSSMTNNKQHIDRDHGRLSPDCRRRL
jgi:hypothetical protein